MLDVGKRSGEDGRIILKWIIERLGGRDADWIDLAQVWDR
jgi:hypothetical protein